MKLHKKILTKEQVNLLPLLKGFSKDFGLVGGTAFAFYIGHRRSIDFDLFTDKEFNNLNIKNKISRRGKIDQTLVNKKGEFTIFINKVKITFFNYPYKINFPKNVDGFIKIPDLLTLAAMKAYSLGHRAKWKDYVDLYFVMQYYCGIDKIIKKAGKIFGKEFNEKLFRSQLSYFKDIDYSEKINYMKGCQIKDGKIKKELIKFSLER